MVKKMKPNVKAIYDYILAHESQNITAKDIAAALGIEDVRRVNGVITMSLQRNRNEEKEIVPLAQRVDAEVEEADGTHTKVKLIKLTDEGRNIEIEEVE